MSNDQGHTPGPWLWAEVDAKSDEVARLENVSGSVVCSFGLSTQYYPSEGEPPNDADARLIAAAPELLAACQEVLRVLEDPRTTGAMPHTAKLLKRVIAKATTPKS